MMTREKASDIDVIAIPANKVSYLKTDDGHADLTLSVSGLYDLQEEQTAQYYVLKRPGGIDETVFKIALEAAFLAVTGLSQLPGTVKAKSTKVKTRQKRAGTTNTERLEKLKETILNDSEWLPAQEVSRRGGASAEVKNPSGLPNRWKQAGKIFAITSEGRDLYPAYALDIGGQPLPLVKKIIEHFGETKTPWSLAVWFGTLNSWLGNKKPKDLLTSEPEKVLEAALMAKEGPVHG